MSNLLFSVRVFAMAIFISVIIAIVCTGCGRDTGPTSPGNHYVVAASNSSVASKAQADYVCDGTDDHVQIQAAIDALPAVGGSVVLSEGNFVGEQVVVKSNVTLKGQGYSTTYTLESGVNEAIIYGEGAATYEDLQNIVIESFRINGNRFNVAGGHCIHIKRALNSTVRDMYIYDCYDDAVRFELTIRGHVEHNFIQWSHNGVTLIDSTFAQNIVSDNVVYAVERASLQCLGYTQECNDNIFANNILRDGEYGVYLYGDSNTWAAAGNIIMGNKILYHRVNTGYGIYLAQNSYDNMIEGNFINDVDVGIYVSSDGSGGQQITDNYTSWTYQDGMIINSDDNLISNNVARAISREDDNTYDILDLGGSNNLVTGNLFQTHEWLGHHRYCINEGVGADNNVIMNNMLEDAGTAAVHIVGANTVVKENKGWVTENQGYAPGAPDFC